MGLSTTQFPDHEPTDLELNEASLLEALVNIRNYQVEDELRGITKPTKLIVTESGIAMVRHRCATEPEFHAAVKERAAEDAEYRQLCESVGIDLT